MKHTILCVDDEIDNVDALERIFRTKYHVLKATSGTQALTILDQNPGKISVIITDQRMPQMTGVEFLTRSIQSHPNSIRILLTGYTDVESIISAVNAGQIYRYINKPWDPLDLVATVDRACERFVLQQELKQKNFDLAKALAELQSLDQAKNQFMILINHELKTPLTSILSFSELLSETQLTEEQALCLARIRKSSERLKDIIEDVLLIVSGETKILKLKVQPFELNSLINQIPDYLAKMLSQKGQKIRLQNENPDIKIVGDPQLILQCLVRIIHNACKFGRENSEIQIDSIILPAHRVRIKIFNPGPPISTAVIDKILKPFHLDEDVMNHSVGLGLGLAICQALLKVHQSHLSVENRSGGVEISFELAYL